MACQVKLPKTSRRQLKKVIPFALEEQLASDPDSILVSIGDMQADGAFRVAVTEKAVFEAQLNMLHETNLYPRCLLPDFLALSWEPGTWSVLLQNQMALVRTDFQNGFSVDANNLFLFLQLQLEKNNCLARK